MHERTNKTGLVNIFHSIDTKYNISFNLNLIIMHTYLWLFNIS